MVYKPSFFEESIKKSLLEPLFGQFMILEMEGKFAVRRPRFPGQSVIRVDKFMDYSIASLMEKHRAEEFKRLTELSRLLFFLPFEINKKVALNLQMSE